MIDHGITHPRMGYKIDTTPHDLRGAGLGTEFTYLHEHIDAPAVCRVIAVSKNSVGDQKYLICLVDGDLLWAIHPHYHTGVDLAVRDADGKWYAAPDVAGVSNALGRAIAISDIPDLIDSGILVPEDELPGHAFEDEATRARMDLIAARSEPYMAFLTEDRE